MYPNSSAGLRFMVDAPPCNVTVGDSGNYRGLGLTSIPIVLLLQNWGVPPKWSGFQEIIY